MPTREDCSPQPQSVNLEIPCRLASDLFVFCFSARAQGNVSAVELLVEAQGDVRARGQEGDEPLHMAASQVCAMRPQTQKDLNTATARVHEHKTQLGLLNTKQHSLGLGLGCGWWSAYAGAFMFGEMGL